MTCAAVPLLAVSLLLGAAVSGCAASRIEASHPLVSSAPDGEVARVYFIRPRTERSLGVADNVVTVEADRTPLLDLAKGEYALLTLRPGAVWITVRSDTSWGPEHDIKEMGTSEEFTFTAGQTYFLTLTAIDGEFRGVTFDPEIIDLDRARQLSTHLRAAGSAARAAPINTL